jgi:hypothetical protein
MGEFEGFEEFEEYEEFQVSGHRAEPRCNVSGFRFQEFKGSKVQRIKGLEV